MWSLIIKDPIYIFNDNFSILSNEWPHGQKMIFVVWHLVFMTNTIPAVRIIEPSAKFLRWKYGLGIEIVYLNQESQKNEKLLPDN